MKEEKKQTQADAKKLYDPLKDPAYQDPYIDVEEPRERMLVDGTIIPFHYVHGGFRGTGVKFIFCMPVKERYGGHFIQYLSPFPGPDEEVASLGQTGEDDKISFALQNGFYFVESNMGSTSQFAGGRDFSLMYKTSAAVAMYLAQRRRTIVTSWPSTAIAPTSRRSRCRSATSRPARSSMLSTRIKRTMLRAAS